MPKGIKGWFGLVVGVFVIFWIIYFTVILPSIAPYLDNIRLTSDQATMKSQARKTRSDWVSLEDKQAASDIPATEVSEWRERFPALQVADDTEVREMIIILKRHPDWTPVSFGEVVGVYSEWYETANYRFEVKKRILFVGPEVTTHKDVPYQVVHPQ